MEKKIKKRSEHQNNWYRKNREKWNAYKRSIYKKKKVKTDWLLESILKMS